MEVNETQSTSQEQHLMLLDFWINGITTNTVVLLGLIGNLLTIVILTKRAMRSSTNYYLCALAVWDSIVLICTALLIGLPAVPQMQYYRSHIFAYIVAYIYPIALIAQTATIWLTVSFTAERYIAVCHPLKAASICTISRAKIVILGVSFGSTLYNIPRWFDFKPVVGFDLTTNTSSADPVRTDFSQNAVYRQVYFSWLYVPIMCIVPLLVLSILNLFLIRAVRRSKKQHKSMNVKQSRENNVTIMLVSVVIVFITCQVPALVYNIAFAIDDHHVESDYSYKILSHFRNFLVSFNSAINFLLYCALGQKFRNIFLHTFCRHCTPDGTYRAVSGTQNHSLVAAAPSTRNYNLKVRNFPSRASTCTQVTNVSPNAHSSHVIASHQSPAAPQDPFKSSQANAAGTYAPPKVTRNAFHRSTDFLDSGDENPAGTERLLSGDPNAENHSHTCN